MTVLWAKMMGVIIQHWLLLTGCWQDPRRSLAKAVKVLQTWLVPLIIELDHPAGLRRILNKLLTNLSHAGRIQSRSRHPSNIQLLQNPSPLSWAA